MLFRSFRKVKRPVIETGKEESLDRSLPVKQRVGHVDLAQVSRQPLGIIPSNVVPSPAMPPKKGKTTHKPIPLKSSSPIVQMDIVTFDQSGRRVSQERRISRSDVQTNPVQQVSRKMHTLDKTILTRQPEIVLSESEDDVPANRSLKAQPKPIAISSDDDSEEESSIPSIQPRFARRPLRAPQFAHNVVISSPSSTDSTPTQDRRVIHNAETPNFPIPQQYTPFEHVIKSQYPVIPSRHLEPAPSRSKPRQLTPIRNRIGRSIAFRIPPSPPSPSAITDLDLDLSLDLEDLTITDCAQDSSTTFEKPPPTYLQPLLQECSQTKPHEFSAFINTFPFDPITRSVHDEGSVNLSEFQKIGEASFSEVFGIGDVVLKVIPLRDESSHVTLNPEDCPAPSDAKDVLNEIIVTRAMGETCDGFVKLLRTYIVRGKYPSLLLDLWDEYHERKGSESVRPGEFTRSVYRQWN